MGDKFANDFSPTTDVVEDFSTINKKKQLLEYLKKYKFERDPFADNLHSGLFFPGCGRQQAVQSILHYSRYGSSPVFLTGPAGSGKTTVLFSAKREMHEDMDIVSIDAQIMMTEERFLSLISKGFGISEDNISVNEIIGVVEANIALGRQSLICIDNVEALSDEVLACLLELMLMCSGQLNVIFVGQKHSEDLLLEAAKSSDLLINRLELSPFNENEVYEYICYRLDAIGFDFEFPFSSIQLRALKHRSQGNINQLHTIARSMLMAGSGDFQQKKNGFPIFHVFLLIFLFGFIGLIYQQKKIQITTEDFSPIILEAAEKKIEKKFSDIDVKKTNENYIHNAAALETSTDKLVVPKKPNNQFNVKKAKVEEKLNDNFKDSHKEKLLSWKSSQYTLQIFRTHNLQKAKKLLKDHEKEIELLIYETRYNGKPSFVVVNGPYSDIEIARSSKNLLPEKVRKLGPWPRNVASIQSDIKRYGSVIDPIP